MNEGEEIRFIDLFSGIGGFRLGLERANRRVDRERGKNICPPRRQEAIDDSRTCLPQGTRDCGCSGDSTQAQGNLGLEKTNHTCKETWREGVGNGKGRRDANIEGSRRRTQQTNDYDFRCVWSCDNGKYANQVYTKQFGEAHRHSADVRGVDPRDIPDFDLLCAGFPCQAFSVAGKRKGFQDTRGTLFFEICRIAEAKKPSLLLLENVKGLLSSGRGQVFYTIIQSLEDLGYWVEWQVLNSKHFGVPQNRERVFLIGHLRGTGGREIFPIGEADGMAQGEAERKREQISLAIDRNYWKGPDKHGQRTVVGVTLANTSRYRQGVNRTPLKKDENSFALNSAGDQGVAISFTNPHNPEEERRVNLSDTSRAVKPPYGNQQPLVLADRTRTLAGLGRNLESPKLITNALSGVQKDNLILENLMIRRLTPVECERLQGFPDGWTEGLSDTQRYKCLGNAVSVPVITFLGRRIMEAEGNG